MTFEFEPDLWCNISGIQAVKLNLLCTDEQECKPVLCDLFIQTPGVLAVDSRPAVQTGTEGALLSQI